MLTKLQTQQQLEHEQQEWNEMNIFEVIAGLFAVIVGVFLIFTLFVWAPISLYAESECLAAGYPKAQVTIGLERYCTTLDGMVTVSVKKVSK